jgi:hypothetical protein
MNRLQAAKLGKAYATEETIVNPKNQENRVEKTRSKNREFIIVPGCKLALSHGFREKSVAVDCIFVVLGANHGFSASQITRPIPPQCCSDHAGYDPR